LDATDNAGATDMAVPDPANVARTICGELAASTLFFDITDIHMLKYRLARYWPVGSGGIR
jgi:hypothetical protein